MKNNNHARTKEKRKKLRLKAFHKKVHEKRMIKKMQALKPKGLTITGPAIHKAIHVSALFPKGDSYLFLFRNENEKKYNQRKRRKLVRQNPHLLTQYK